MDLMDLMNLWEAMGNVIVGHSADDGHYTLFVKLTEKGSYGNVLGHVKATGSGYFWDLPESLMKERQRELEVAHEEDKLEGGE